MSNDIEQKIAKRDLQALIEESNRHKKWINVYKLAQIILTPLIITIVSMLVTWRINIQQAENTEKITEKQIESAEIIAAANRENSAKISESNQRTERLNQIKEIFTKLLTKKESGLSDTDIEPHRIQIISLEVYKGDALPFLLNMKEHYQKSQEKSQNDAYKELIDQIDKSIYNILLNSQIDVSGHIFVNCGTPSCKVIEKEIADYRAKLTKSIANQSQAFKGIKSQIKTDQILKYKTTGNSNSLIEKYKNLKKETMQISNAFMAEHKDNKLIEINMRKQGYKNYNFSDCSFLNVNLYKADFSSCTMNNNLFVKVDLQEASFFDTNLSGSIFLKSNLQKAVFKDSKLRSNVVFVNPIMNLRDADNQVKDFCNKNSCCELEGAQFSLGSLQYTAQPPFDIFDIDYAKNGDIGEKLKEERRQLYLNLLMHHLPSISNMLEAAKKGDKKQIENRDNLINNTGAKDEEDLIIRLEGAAEKAKILATPATATKKSLVSKR